MNIQKSLSLKKYSISDRNFLDKKQQSSIRYANVKSKTNSGFNASKRHEIDKEIFKYYNVRSDEVFKRISLGNLIQLIVAFAEECNLIGLPPECVSNNEIESVESIQDSKSEVTNNMHTFTPNSNVQEVVEACDSAQDKSKSLSCPFLIIDVRGENEFKECHLATAIWHPHLRLSRSVGWESAEMRDYKNKPERIIVIYDENETMSSEVASMLIHRGYSNTFVLSGGIKLARDKIGYPFVTKDGSKSLTPLVANFLSERLSFTVLPSHQLQDTVDWLQTKMSKAPSQSNKEEIEIVASKNTQQGKKIPWR